jgi:integrase
MAKSAANGESLLNCKGFRFTPERLREACRLVAESGGRQAWRDEGCKQLEVRVGGRGGVFYRFGQDSVRRRLVRERIGDVAGPNAIPLEAARKKCEQLRVDPKARAALPRRRIGSGGPTIKEAWERYTIAITSGRFSMRRGRKPLTASTIAAYKHVYGAHLKSHEEQTLHWLAANFKDLFETVGTQGSADHGKASPGAANKLLQIGKNLFEFCRSEETWSAANPAIDPRTGRTYDKFPLQKREARLTREQAKRLSKALAKSGPYWADFFTIAALTGRRLANVRKLRWDSIDLSHALILDSGAAMKNGQPNHGALGKTAMKILRRLRRTAKPDAEWVFPGRRPGEPVRNPHHAWKKIKVEAGLPKLRIHDLRHNAASWATGEGKNERAVGRYLGHRSAASTSRYQHANTEDARSVADAVDTIWCRSTGS